MLDPWIIEEIRRREEEERRHRDDRPVLELPLERPAAPSEPDAYGNINHPNVDRGVAILNFQI